MADGVIPERRLHRSKFLLAYFVLAAIVGIAVAAFLVFAQTDSTRTPAAAGADGPPAEVLTVSVCMKTRKTATATPTIAASTK